MGRNYVTWDGKSQPTARTLTTRRAQDLTVAGHYIRPVETWNAEAARYGLWTVTMLGRHPRRYRVTQSAAEWADTHNLIADAQPVQATQRRSRTA